MRNKNLAVAAGMVVVVAAGFLLARALPNGAEKPGKERPADGNTAGAADEPEARQAPAEPAESKPQEAVALGNEILAALDELEACAQRWDEQVVPLLSNAQGTLLTHDAATMSRFRELYGRVDSAQLRQTARELRATVQEFVDVLDAAGDLAYSPTSMRQTKQVVGNLLAGCSQTHREIEQLLSVAQQRPAAPRTSLKEAMTEQAAGQRP